MDELARRLARGEPSAFEELYDAHASRVHHYLVARLGSRADADDALQEVFVGLARSRRRLASVTSLAAYLFAAARNEAARLLERRTSEGRRIVGLWEAASSEVPGQPNRENAEWLAAALGRISPEQREVIELKIHGDLTFREIAAVTGLPQGTVATRYRSALESLRGQLVKE